jgi:hypothetical protein
MPVEKPEAETEYQYLSRHVETLKANLRDLERSKSRGEVDEESYQRMKRDAEQALGGRKSELARCRKGLKMEFERER